MGHLHVSSASSSSFFGFSGSKFLSNNNDLNLDLRSSFSPFILKFSSLFIFTLEEVFFETALAFKFSRCAFPITALRVTPPIETAILLAV